MAGTFWYLDYYRPLEEIGGALGGIGEYNTIAVAVVSGGYEAFVLPKLQVWKEHVPNHVRSVILLPTCDFMPTLTDNVKWREFALDINKVYDFFQGKVTVGLDIEWSAGFYERGEQPLDLNKFREGVKYFGRCLYRDIKEILCYDVIWQHPSDTTGQRIRKMHVVSNVYAALGQRVRMFDVRYGTKGTAYSPDFQANLEIERCLSRDFTPHEQMFTCGEWWTLADLPAGIRMVFDAGLDAYIYPGQPYTAEQSQQISSAIEEALRY